MENCNSEHSVKPGIYRCFYLMAVVVGIILMTMPAYVLAQESDPHDIYDLRPGVERYYTSCITFSWQLLSCGQVYYTYLMDRVIGYTALDGLEYAEIERIVISNEQMIVGRDTLYQRIEGNTLLQRRESEQGPEEVVIYRFDFVPGDSVKQYIRNVEVENEYDQFENLSVITADTTVTFPDGGRYRVVYGSDDTYPWDNARLVGELSVDWLNTVIRRGTLGSSVIGLNWLVPFANMKELQHEPPFYIGIHTFYHVSRFGPILSMAFTGWRYLTGFKSHDGQMYGYFHEGIPGAPLSIDWKGKEGVIEFRILGNYPNPFNPSTVIRYQLHEASEVRLEIVNMLGQQVGLPVNHEIQRAGIHDIVFNASGLSSGVYLYRLVAYPPGLSNIHTRVSTGKMLFIK